MLLSREAVYSGSLLAEENPHNNGRRSHFKEDVGIKPCRKRSYKSCVNIRTV